MTNAAASHTAADDRDYQELRDAMRDLCKQYPDEYWRKIDDARGYPEAFVDALTKAGWMATLIPEQFGGSGLGLSLAQSYVHQHQGLIEFESVPGRTCFTILLPVRSPAQAGLARPPSEGDKP